MTSPSHPVFDSALAAATLTALTASSTPTVIGPYGKAAAVIVPIDCYPAAPLMPGANFTPISSPDGDVMQMLLSGPAAQVAAGRLWTVSAPRAEPRTVGQMRIDPTTMHGVTAVVA